MGSHLKKKKTTKSKQTKKCKSVKSKKNLEIIIRNFHPGKSRTQEKKVHLFKSHF